MNVLLIRIVGAQILMSPGEIHLSDNFYFKHPSITTCIPSFISCFRLVIYMCYPKNLFEENPMILGLSLKGSYLKQSAEKKNKQKKKQVVEQANYTSTILVDFSTMTNGELQAG